MKPPPSIVIVGAGIGGLTAALTLARAHCRVTLVDRAQVLSEVGAGLQLSPNASRILIDHDIGPWFRASAVYPEAIRIFSTRSGGEVAELPLGAAFAARYGAPYLVIHRGDLQSALLTTVRSTPEIDLRLGVSVTRVEETSAGLAIDLDSGETIAADGLVGADGVRSTIRTDVVGGAPARFSGRIAYRATIPIEQVPASLRHVTCVWMAPDAHLVHYPIRGGTEFNLVAVTESDWREDGWSAPASRDDVIARFAPSSGLPWPEAARALIAAPQVWTKWALSAVDPRFGWSRGRVTLLGDAAHAMLPFAAQGAAMAIEDAEVLATALTVEPDVASAFAAYEAARKPRVAAVVDLAASNGRIYHLGSLAATLRDTALKHLPARFALDRQDWIYGWRAA